MVFVLALAPVVAAAERAGPSGRVAVVDGDTWDVGGQRVRLFGIDAPEAQQTCANEDYPAWRCGAWVGAEVRARYQGRLARCTQVDTDRYGRIVARCSVDGQDVGRELVSAGLALAYRKYSMDYDLDEKGAAVNGRGVHASRFQDPAEFRRYGAPDPAGRAANCDIKGNISSKGERIYHVPGQEHYGRTRISPEKGERWFCSPAEARAAGWRPARR